MKRTIYLTFMSVLVALSAVAQEPPREVVVTRDYEPDVSTFQKLDFAPRDLDTVALQPDMDYTIKPVQLTPNMPLRLAEPEKMDVAQRLIRYPYYLRAGLGLPISSLLDFYATDYSDKYKRLGAYLNHDGAYASVKNDADKNSSSLAVRNAFGFYSLIGDNRLFCNAGIFGNVDIYNPYGQFTPLHIAAEPIAEHILKYGYVSGVFEAGQILNSFAYRAEIKAGTFNATHDAGTLYLWHINFDGSVGVKLGEGELKVGLPVDYESGVNSDFRLGVVPSYKLKVLDRINLNLGAQLLYNNHKNFANRLYFYPIVEADMALGDGVKWYVWWTGELGQSGLRSLAQRNPYLDVDNLGAKNSSLNRFKIGIDGSAVQIVTYDVFAGGDIWRDYVYFVSRPTGLFDVRNVDVVNNYYVGAAVAVQPFVGLEFSANGRYNYFDPTPELGTAIPRWQATLKAQYSYRTRFFARLGADFLGERRLATADDLSGLGVDVISNSINLSAELEACVSRSVNVFVRGENLLNQRIETFNHYFIPGIRVIAGVKIVF